MNGKEAAGRKAAEFVKKGMRVGLGTGSTVAYFLDELSKHLKKGLTIEAFASSIATAQKAKALGLPLQDPDQLQTLDLVVDGADEVDPEGNLIKGAGGALLREKILAFHAEEIIIIVDETKLSASLGKTPLPVEILPFGYRATLSILTDLGFTTELRLQNDKTPFVSDNGNYLAFLRLSKPMISPETVDATLHSVPGVLETGLFCGLSPKILVGKDSGSTYFVD